VEEGLCRIKVANPLRGASRRHSEARALAREPGIHGTWTWIPGPALRAVPE